MTEVDDRDPEEVIADLEKMLEEAQQTERLARKLFEALSELVDHLENKHA